MNELAQIQKSGTKESSNRKADLRLQIHEIQCSIQAKVHEVRVEFYKMIRKVLVSYTADNLLIQFKGALKGTRHMTNFMRWYIRRDIYQLIRKKEFKHEAKSLDEQPLYRQMFYQRLIYYPLMQNFIVEKFFPKCIEDNIKQMHGLKEFDLAKTFSE